ncbi:hypothetical protein Xph01_55270 [Micromonospora phaseoli]|nr:hypothetical protein Xph01_55270 [Micromonospora phaseoli]
MRLLSAQLQSDERDCRWRAVRDWATAQRFYNQRRRHSGCDWRSPIDYKRLTARLPEAQAA